MCIYTVNINIKSYVKTEKNIRSINNPEVYHLNNIRGVYVCV